MQDFADICYTSQSSISRFSQYLGYANFNDFKADCIGIQEETDEMIIDTRATKKINCVDYAQAISESLVRMQETSIDQEIEQLCEYIHNAKRIFIFATHIPGDLLHYATCNFNNG